MASSSPSPAPATLTCRLAPDRVTKSIRTCGSNATAVIATLGPVIRGWTAYHRCMVSSEAFQSLAAYMWKLTWKWARHSHPNKGPRWVAARYFGKFHPYREDRWVFGDKGTGASLVSHSCPSVGAHVMVMALSSPTNPALAGPGRLSRVRPVPPPAAPPLPRSPCRAGTPPLGGA